MTQFEQPEEALRANDVADPWAAILYASQQIGCPRPIGHKRRGLMFRRIHEEMELQRWSWRHLTAAVDYMKHRGIKARSFDYIFYHVDDALKNGFMPRAVTTTADDLNDAVAQAIHIETDDAWIRKLLLARGSSLRTVYDMWRSERGALLEVN